MKKLSIIIFVLVSIAAQAAQTPKNIRGYWYCTSYFTSDDRIPRRPQGEYKQIFCTVSKDSISYADGPTYKIQSVFMRTNNRHKIIYDVFLKDSNIILCILYMKEARFWSVTHSYLDQFLTWHAVQIRVKKFTGPEDEI